MASDPPIKLCDCGKPAEGLVCMCGVDGCSSCRFDASCYCGRLGCKRCTNRAGFCRRCWDVGNYRWKPEDADEVEVEVLLEIDPTYVGIKFSRALELEEARQLFIDEVKAELACQARAAAERVANKALGQYLANAAAPPNKQLPDGGEL